VGPAAKGSALLADFRRGFPEGFTQVTREGEAELDTGIDFGIYRLAKGDTVREAHPKESAWLLLGGKAELEFQGQRAVVARASLFEEGPTALHLPPGAELRLRALSEAEFARLNVKNGRGFVPRLFLPRDVPAEYRGRGWAQGACLRIVRSIFDLRNRPESSLVLGEVVTLPGRWSSYPPHYHPQPEIYHYRFTDPRGYGHGESGEEVHKVRAYDTLKILDCKGHAQAAAPGYGMYYLWAVRHLEGNPYTGFKYFEEHERLADPKNQGWVPKDDNP